MHQNEKDISSFIHLFLSLFPGTFCIAYILPRTISGQNQHQTKLTDISKNLIQAYQLAKRVWKDPSWFRAD